MSIRTFVEINHDMLYRVRENPDALADLLSRAVLRSERGRAGDPAVVLRNHFGIHVLTSRHHSDSVEIVVKGFQLWQEDVPVKREQLLDQLRKARREIKRERDHLADDGAVKDARGRPDMRTLDGALKRDVKRKDRIIAAIYAVLK